MKIGMDMINNLVSTILNPVATFNRLSSNTRFGDILFIITLLFSASAILSGQISRINYHDQSIVVYMVMIALGLIVYLLGSMSFIIESIYIKIILSTQNRREKLGIIATVMAYAMVPSILYSWLLVAFPDLLVTSIINGKTNILYSKISLGYLLHGYSKAYPIIFNAIKSLNFFYIWTSVLEVIALAVLGRFTYSKSLLVLMPYWLCSALIPALLAYL